MTGVRSPPLLAALLRLLPAGAGGGWRALEIGTDPQAGASAAELADRSGGSVVSVSQSSQVIARAWFARATHPQLSFHRQIPLAAGWPAAAPYDLAAPRGAVMYPPCSGERLEEMSLDLMASPGLERERGT